MDQDGFYQPMSLLDSDVTLGNKMLPKLSVTHDPVSDIIKPKVLYLLMLSRLSRGRKLIRLGGNFSLFSNGSASKLLSLQPHEEGQSL